MPRRSSGGESKLGAAYTARDGNRRSSGGIASGSGARVRASSAGSMPHNGEARGLRRFTVAQKSSFHRAVEELRAGRKATCWVWFMVPTPPYIVDSVERGSFMNRKYALRTDKEGRAFLHFKADGIDLRANYLEIMTVLRDQMRSGKSCASLMGMKDAPKVRSSASLFERLTAGGVDNELHAVVSDVLDLVC